MYSFKLIKIDIFGPINCPCKVEWNTCESIVCAFKQLSRWFSSAYIDFNQRSLTALFGGCESSEKAEHFFEVHDTNGVWSNGSLDNLSGITRKWWMTFERFGWLVSNWHHAHKMNTLKWFNINRIHFIQSKMRSDAISNPAIIFIIAKWYFSVHFEHAKYHPIAMSQMRNRIVIKSYYVI